MQDDSNRNTIIFVIAAILLLLGYQQFVMAPAAKQRAAQAAAEAAANPKAAPGVVGAPGVAAAPKIVTRQEAAALSPRVPIASPALMGSISLRGARLDDLFLTQYRTDVDPKSPPVELFRPEGAEHAWFAELGWTGQNLPGMPNRDSLWSVAEGSTVAPGKPLVLRYVAGNGLVFTRRVELDDKFMFTITDTVANLSAAPVTVAPYASIQRLGIPQELGKTQIVHEGGVGVLGEPGASDDGKPKLREFKYPKWVKDGGKTIRSQGGWAGLTDKFWLAAFIPPQGETIDATFKVTRSGDLNIFESNYLGRARVIPPGKQVSETTHLFAGAKTVPLLQSYEKSLGAKGLDQAVDWGFLFFLTRPMFQALELFFRWVGNFGFAILMLTVVVRLIFFPLAQKQYESITKMKKVQPQMEELKAKFKDDPQKQQQELMALYQREKVNPLAGCIPILFQIPVFYALYKVLTVTIEMRHAPFVGYIKDLSARDPTTIWTLFGLIPWHPASVPFVGGILDTTLHLGVLPILYGITMWLTTSMSPPAGDPVQQKIFQFMPVFFTFIMAPFAVGLLIYWTWSNVISIVQQYVIMRRFKVDNPIDKLIRRLTGKEAPAG